MNTQLLKARTLRTIEIISLLALGVSGLENGKLIVAVLFAGLSLELLKEYFPGRIAIGSEIVLSCLFAGLFALIAALYRFSDLHSVELAAHGLIGLTFFCWLLKPLRRPEVWRSIVYFLAVVLSAMSEPSTSLGLVVVIYLGLVLFYLMIKDWQEQFITVSGSSLLQALILIGGASLSLAYLGFLPLRNTLSQFPQWHPPKIGYSEIVRTQGDMTFLSASNPALALQIDFQSASGSGEIPYNLIRMRALPFFDGELWRPATGIPNQNPQPAAEPNAHLILVTRYALGTDSLPMLYGAALRRMKTASSFAHNTVQDEWQVKDSGQKIMEYYLEAPRNPPATSHLMLAQLKPSLIEVPEMSEKFQLKLNGYSKQVLGQTHSPLKRMLILNDHFRKNGGYQAYIPTAQNADFPRLEDNLEEFVFNSRRGHCERFSTAMAILLRLNKIPARIVSGFRLSSPQQNGVYSIRHEDAHVWVEAWDEQFGWVPLDPTPGVARSAWELGVWMRYFQDSIDTLTLRIKQWAQSSLALFGQGWLLTAAVSLFLFTVGMLIIGGALWFLRRTGTSATKQPNWVYSEFPGFDAPGLIDKSNLRELARLKQKLEAASDQVTRQNLQALYQTLRFGPARPNTPDWKLLVKKAKLIADSL